MTLRLASLLIIFLLCVSVLTHAQCTLVLNPTGDTTACADVTPISLTSGATSTSMPLTYSWAPSTGLACATCDPITFTPAAGLIVYTVVVTDGSGCSDTAAIRVFGMVSPRPITGPTHVCVGATITLSDAVGGGTWSSSRPAVASVGSLSGVVSGITVGNTVITYATAPGPCFVTTTITVDPLPDAGVIIGPSNVCVGSIINLTDAVAGGTWSSSSGSATVSPFGAVTGITAGIAIISYTVTNSCGTDYALKTVTVNPTPGPISGVTSICVNTTTTLSDPVPGGVWTSSNPSVASVGSLTGIVTGNTIGGAIITYKLPGGCFVVAPVAITAGPDAGVILGPSSVCAGSTIALSDPILGGTWSSTGTGVATVGLTTGIVTGVAAGTVTIRYIITNSCGSDTATKMITVYRVPGPITGNTTLCINGTTTLSDSVAGGTWSSTNPSVATIHPVNGTVTGISPGVATISYTLPGGCFVTIGVTVIDSPDAGAITGLTNVCVGSTITLSDPAGGGVWSSGTPATATVGASTGIVSGVSPGVVVISYTVTNFCGTDVAIKSVTVDPIPAPITGLMNICTGDSTFLSDSTAGGKWTSSDTSVATIDSILGIVHGIAPGTSIITYKFPGGCYVTALITVKDTTNPGNISGPPALCAGQTITWTSTEPGGVWTSGNTSIATIGSSSGIVTGVAAGRAVITYTVVFTCGTAFTTKTVTVYPIPDPGIISGDSILCDEDTIVLTNPVTGGVWISSRPGIATVSAGTVTGVSAGTAVITYAVSVSGCNARTTKTVTVDPLPDAGVISGPASVCPGDTIILSDTAAGGTGTWTNTAHYTVFISGKLIGVTPGIDTIRYMVTNRCGHDTAEKIVTVLSLPDAGIIYGPDSVCFGTALLLSDSVTGGVWGISEPAIATIDSFSGIVTMGSAGFVTISYSVTGDCGIAVATKTITIHPIPVAGTIYGNNTQVCAGTVFTLSDEVSGGTWSISDTMIALIDSNSGTVNTKTYGTAVVTYTIASAYGCVGFATDTISVTPMTFSIAAAIDAVSCQGGNNGRISITTNGGAGPYEYSWSNGLTAAVADSLIAGAYVLHITELPTKCSLKDSFLITEPDTLTIESEITNDVCRAGNGSIKVKVFGGTLSYNFKWGGLPSSETSVAALYEGVYILTVTDANTCARDFQLLVKKDSCLGVIVHDVITTNGDGINDLWVIERLEYYPKNTVQLFDKWGDLIFEKQGYQNDWNGVGKDGAVIPDGTYFYLVKLNAANASGGPNVFTGSLLIKR